jgi:serine phosphatase RsbU (regulator of sigma subunit)
MFDAGVENVLVTFGVKLCAGTLNFLIKTDFQYITIALNNDMVAGDTCGNEAALKMRSKLLHYFDAYQIEISLPTKKDFGDMSKEEIQTWKQPKLCRPAV